jgi:hypothetical protein
VIIVSLSFFPRFHTFEVWGRVQGHQVIVLINGGEIHNFIDSSLVTRRGIPTIYLERFDVVIIGVCSVSWKKKVL